MYLLLLLTLLAHLLQSDFFLYFGNVIRCQLLGSPSRDSRGFLILPALCLLIFNLLGLITELQVSELTPAIDNLKHLSDRWPLVWVRDKKDADEIFHLNWDPWGALTIRRHEIVSIYNSKFLSFLEGVLAEAQSVEDTAKHPNVRLLRHVESLVLIDHFWRPIHQSRVLLEFLKHIINLMLACSLRKIQSFYWSTSEIAELELFAVKEDILNFDISVGDFLLMHYLEAARETLISDTLTWRLPS